MEESWKEYELAQFAEKAERHGVCDKDLFARKLKMCRTKEDTMRMYIRCIDWCLETQYPDLDFLRREYKNEDMERMGAYFDREFDGELFDRRQAYVFHHCAGRIRVAMDCENAVIPMLYFAYGCRMEICCEQDNYGHPIRVPLYIFGDNDIVADGNKNACYARYHSELK